MGDIASAAIRGARINIDMEEFRDGVFPVFRRRRRDEDEGIDEDDDSDGENTFELGRKSGCISYLASHPLVVDKYRKLILE